MLLKLFFAVMGLVALAWMFGRLLASFRPGVKRERRRLREQQRR